MKKIFVLGMAVLMVVGFAGVSMAVGITGSAHDFSSKTWNTSDGGQICVVCHTPHNADNTVAEAPLWNHQVTAAVFTVYSSTTLDADDLGSPSDSSKLCLSCHDGTVAVDNFGGKTTGEEYVTGDDLVGINLSDDHPISFTYDAALATLDGGLYDPTIITSGLGGTIDADLLFGNKLQCASCHDVHNAANVASLLRKSNDASALCLTCHDK